MPTTTELIKARARTLGFAKAGVTRAVHLSDEFVHLTEWLRKGYHGTMEWMAKNGEKRADPGAIVPNAASIVSVAMNYFVDVHPADEPGVGKISRYAWGDDYHLVMTKKLGELEEYIREIEPGAATRRYVDTGPAMDKVWAAKAGLGWQGKHTNLITKDFGSWVFLGEIITDLKLEYDEPMADFCGSCTACIEACPTGAIVEPYVLDSNKCISYLTIEHKGDIPDDLKPNLEGWVYGCDICQDVCPWNSFQQPTEEPSFAPREENLSPKLSELAEMTQEEFTANFSKSAIKRAKHSGLVRNARAALEALKSR